MRRANKITPEMAAKELLRRERAAESLVDYSKAIVIPGKPVDDAADENDWVFHPVETGIAKHHSLIMQACQDVFDGKIKNLMLFFPPGSAKALALDTPIPTPTGWSIMGDLKVGDQVFDETGTPCNIKRVSDVWEDRPVYSVATDCGDEIIADEDHDWRVCLCRKPRKPLKNNGVGRKPLPNRDDAASQFKIKKTIELVRKRSKRPMIERAKALVLPEASLPVDPYLLGVWLGDGNSSGVWITSSIDDQPWLRSEIERLGYKTSDSSQPTLFGVLGVRAEFVSLGLINDPFHNTHGRKHIPAKYLRGSINQRTALLQGLVDTDGTVCKRRGCATFCSTNKELAEQVRELVRTLGIKAGWSESRAVLNGKDCGPSYKVSFYKKDAARMPRKAALCRDQYRTPNTYIEATPAGTADTVCIEVDSASHLFLAGRSMTPTHNSTYASVVFPTWAMGRKPGTQIILASYGADLAKKHGRRARQIVSSRDYKAIFGATISAKTQAADFWATDEGSEYMACGILSGITGNRADGIVIDDPIKGRAEADSETIRDKTWEAYQDDLMTRLKPGGWQIMILTRWHEDDPAGRILPEDYEGQSGWIQSRTDGEVWYVLCCPAECERKDDPLGREIGETLWPEWFTSGHFNKFKAIPRTWNALFQQRPAPDEGTFFRREWFKRFDFGEEPGYLHRYGTSDYAVTDDGGDYTEHGVFGVDEGDDVWALAWWFGQKTADVWIEELCDLVMAHRPFVWFGEGGVIRKAIEPFLTKRLLERKAFVRLEWVNPIHDKPTRARGAQARAAQGKIHIPNCEWGDRLIEQLTKFPAGSVDDAVDVLSLFGLVLDQAHPAIVPMAKTQKTSTERRIEALKQLPADDFQDYAERELAAYERDSELHIFGEVEEYDDGSTVNTI